MTYSQFLLPSWPDFSLKKQQHTFTVNEPFNLDKYIISRSEPERTF